MDPFLYQYGIGGAVFALGLVYGSRQGYLGLRGSGLRNLFVCVAGLLGFMLLQGTLQYAPMQEAAAVPYQGGYQRKAQLGTSLDYAIMVAYFGAMLLIGTWFGRGNSSTRDFFFGGQRFSWWLIAFSLVATTIGSYSFVKYSKVAFSFGTASSQTYLNDWLWVPLLLFGWLPILYFSRVVSIPEYFERRFGPGARSLATWLLLAYLVGYVGINLFTMGQALSILLGWPVLGAAVLVASVSAVYVTFGGQTSVIMTDLFQGAMLLATGLVLLFLGMDYLGGASAFWEHLPRGHRTAFPHFNADPSYPAVGIFWQDAMANSAMFYFLNQGMVMRLLSARSVEDSRKAVIAMMAILMPLAAVVVASGGWVARALVHAGVLPPDIAPKESFFIAAEFLTQPGVFGLVMAALTAALMSTVDTLITAIAAIIVNDVYRPRRPQATDRQLLSVARWSSIGITLFGVALVPIFQSFGSIYSAHGAFTAAVTPPLVIALLFGVFWRRYTSIAALWTMALGSLIIAASILWPQMIAPFAHGVEMREVGDGLLAGKDQFKFMRGFFGLVVCALIGVVATLTSQARPLNEIRGLVWGTISDAIANYKGSPGAEQSGPWVAASGQPWQQDEVRGEALLAVVAISSTLAEQLGAAREGDLLYVSDARVWLGGLRSAHAVVGTIFKDDSPVIRMGSGPYKVVIASGREDALLRIRKLY
ncbi:MAG: sodium:proline symporter [Rickettsiales bacterium]|nr:sodium:proline symporter [Rickettsiales bacterium]